MSEQDLGRWGEGIAPQLPLTLAVLETGLLICTLRSTAVAGFQGSLCGSGAACFREPAQISCGVKPADNA